MSNRLRSFLNQPYPFTCSPTQYITIIVGFALFVGLFLAIFKPFGLTNLPDNIVYWSAAGFAGVTFVSLLFFLVLTKLFPDYFNEDNWTLGKEISYSLFNFLAVGHGNYLYIRYGTLAGHDTLNYVSMILGTFAVGFFPFLFFSMLMHVRRLQRNMKLASDLNQSIAEDEVAHTSDAEIELVGENVADKLRVRQDQLLYIQSSGNYIEVVHNDGEHVHKTLLRNSISSTEQALLQMPSMFRCHRKFLVNLERIEEVMGNSQGYRIRLDKDVEPIPVARTKNAEFREKLGAIHAQTA